MKLLKCFSILITIFLSGCATDLSTISVVDEKTTINDSLVPNTQSKTFNLSKDCIREVVKIPAGIGAVTLTNVNGRKISVISQNNTSSAIDSEKALKVASVMSGDRAAFSDTEIPYLETDDEINSKNGFTSVTIPAPSQDALDNTNNARSITDEPQLLASYDPGPAARVGSRKSLFVDNNPSLTSFTKKYATLRYSGTYCNIWSIDNEDILDAVSTQKLAKTFDAHYHAVRETFGAESNKLFVSNGSSLFLDDIEKHSNTGTKINIVVYKITQPSVIGYFHAKDYFQTAEELSLTTGNTYKSTNSANYSNGGKFFYINYRYVSGSAENRKLAESTLIHEFQHMIHYSVKNMNGLSPQTWYNEMMSLLAEDMFANKIQTGMKQPAIMRMNDFREYYYQSGLTEFPNIHSYGTAYAFGAWLVRTFGGADFIKLMMSNRLVNEASVLDAVNSITPTPFENFNALFNTYVNDCISGEGFKESITSVVNYNNYTFNQIKGAPLVNSVSPSLGTSIGPYGFVYRQIEAGTNSSITLNLSERTVNETIHIIVQ